MKQIKLGLLGISFSFCILSQISLACPSGQHEECILPRPWGGCIKRICVPNIHNPLEDIQKAINEKAMQLAITGRESEKIKNREDCMVIVTAGLAAWGAAQGGTIGAVVGGTAGAAASSMACRNVFPL